MCETPNNEGGGAISPHFRIYMMIYFCMIAAVVIFDQAVKYFISSGMITGQTIPVIENVVHITYVRNEGAAFSMWEQQWIILIVLPAAALAAGLILIFRKHRTWSKCMLTAVSFICGGGIGNLIDRVSNGYVIDMFDCRFISFIDFPVFNVADIFICVGCGLLLLDVIFLEGRRSRNEG